MAIRLVQLIHSELHLVDHSAEVLLPDELGPSQIVLRPALHFIQLGPDAFKMLLHTLFGFRKLLVSEILLLIQLLQSLIQFHLNEFFFELERLRIAFTFGIRIFNSIFLR